ncbi:MAG: hypothetical protein KA121_09240 [Ferruginibacter sp.]|nr:hypothetical protein [Ferruginibacter sp.]HAO05239.1 hypothetical protein [Chitinophagaceae bacterium]
MAILCFLQLNCKKEYFYKAKPNVANKFFALPSGTNTSVVRVMNEIKKRNERKEFVTKFATQNGYPVWNKVLMGTSQKQYAHASLAGNSLDGVTDTTILIPFVMEGELLVKGFIRATLNDSVSLSYSLAKDYKAYEEKLDNSKTASSAFAMLSMVLNKIVFNEEYYKITNPKLFSDDTAHVSTQKIKIENISFTIMDSAGLKYISLCSTSAIYKTYCPANGKCSEDGTSCDVPPSPCPSGELICFCTQGKCYNYLNNSTTCSTIVIPDISFGGGYGDGGDSNGGGPIPYVYPCESTQNNPAPFTATNNVADPGDCPEPTEGDGWIPWQDEPPYVCNYQMTQNEKDVFLQLDEEDNQADFIHQNLDCQGTKRTGNVFFQGTKEHWIIQLDYVSKNPLNSDVEYAIPFASSTNPNNRGYADIVNLQDKTIFEIKLNNQNGQTSGVSEVANYVEKANMHCANQFPTSISWHTGTNYSSVLLPTSNSNKYLKANLYAPGVIVYDYITTDNPVPAPPIVVPTTIVDKFKHLIDRLRQNFQQADKIIAEFFYQHPELKNYIKSTAIGAGIALIVSTILEDVITAGAGIADDWVCFVLAYRIIRFAVAL